MAFLKSGEPVVVDTHVLAEAARQDRDGQPGEEREFLRALVDRCPRVVLSADQRSRDDRRGELVASLRRKGFRFPSESSLIDHLAAQGKLSTLPRSGTKALSAQVIAGFRGRGGHDDVTDDIHLYEAAQARRTIVVTKDPHLLERAADFAALTGVETVDPTTALARWAGESEETP